MFSSSNIYKLFKPEQEPNLITDYEVIIGGTALTANFHKGIILVNVLNSRAVTSQYNDIKNINHDDEMDIYSISQSSYIETKYQIDIYKINSKNAQVIEAEVEAYKIREWLKSYTISEYLDSLNADILPFYGDIRFSSEFLNKDLVNRASFDISIISKIEIKEPTTVADKALIINNNIF
ncbi:hypothetical protein [Campylobacter lanienae]|uniref:hypothetical protein n=1 Tax=Campylobacter lanienae TaxID=75658 RepID=UPI00242AC575|nr:hypothetical protein [Campylobacter lanienae]MDD5786027.1 hypothetical protein [Campylobacter lanienae]